jgi:hypothetical protein
VFSLLRVRGGHEQRREVISGLIGVEEKTLSFYLFKNWFILVSFAWALVFSLKPYLKLASFSS